MAGGGSVGTIDSGDILRLGPSYDTSDERRNDLLFPYPSLRRIVARDALCKRGNQKTTLISADEQPRIELFHAEVDVLFVTANLVDAKDVTRHDHG